MIYHINQGIGWASSGVEYAQKYRSDLLNSLGLDSRFVFTDLILGDNLLHFTHHLGLQDHQILWLYTAFSDLDLTPACLELEDFLKLLGQSPLKIDHGQDTCLLHFEAYQLKLSFSPARGHKLIRVETYQDGKMTRRDFYGGQVYAREFFHQDRIYCRQWLNQDQSVSLEEIIDKDQILYRLGNRVFYTKEALFAHFLVQLGLSSEDWLVLDRSSQMGQAILENRADAKIAVVVHAEHYAASSSGPEGIHWNNFYDYVFQKAKWIDVFICSTQLQSQILSQQLAQYQGVQAKLVTIPVGYLDHLIQPQVQRKPASFVTASRLASEKHIDWLVQAMALVCQEFPQATLDIFGQGGEEARLRDMIRELGLENHVRLMGHQKMSQIYQHYEIYVSASGSEGFGLTLMEAVGSGLAMIGFDVPYGNPSFIIPNGNGILLDKKDFFNYESSIQSLAQAMKGILQEDLAPYHQVSYEVASDYLGTKVAQQWKELFRNV